jgi:hypothetical protein
MPRLSRFFLLIIIAFAVLQSRCGKEMNSADGKISGAGGSLARFAIIGSYLYIVSQSDLDVFDMSDPTKPVLKKTVPVGFMVETIFPFNDKLFMGGEFGMYIFSLEQPDNPRKEGSVQHLRSCDPVVANDSLAYVTLTRQSRCGGGINALHVYAVKNIMNPVLLYEQEMKSPGGLATKQNALYVCQAENGLAIFDLKNPKRPAMIQELKDEAYYDVIPYGNLLIAYIKDGISFFDVTDPLKPVLLSQMKG